MSTPAPLDQLRFDTRDYQPHGERPGLRMFAAPGGDLVGVHHFALPPDIKASLDDADGVRHFYLGGIESAGLGVLSIDPVTIAGGPAVKVLIKAPQEPSGRIYLATLTLPFRDFSYVVKVQCGEHGMTGRRDAVILAEAMADGRVTMDPANQTMRGWQADRYDPDATGPLVRNLSEDEAYDARFPDHPLSRARAIVRHLEATLTLDPAVRAAPPFVYAA